MFNLERMRTMNLDQSRPWRVFTLQADLTTTEGLIYRRDAQFRFEYAFANVLTGEAEIHGLDADGREIVFLTKNREHRTLFADTGEEWRPGGKPPSKPKPPPQGSAEQEWLQWLDTNADFKEAHAILAGASRQANDWGAHRQTAEVLRRAAVAIAAAGQTDMAAWLAGRALNYYHAWMSQATSGGEGSAMEYEIRDQLKEMRKLSRRP
jgi:hypothetical protein